MTTDNALTIVHIREQGLSFQETFQEGKEK